MAIVHCSQRTTGIHRSRVVEEFERLLVWSRYIGAIGESNIRGSFPKSASRPVLEPTEDMDVLLETLDLQRCMMIPLASASVGSKLQEWHSESNRQRYNHIAANIDGSLGENETGLLLISERHQVQFPSDIEVFYVSPPALDEYRRWFNNWMEQQQADAAAARQPSQEQSGDDGDEPEGKEESSS